MSKTNFYCVLNLLQIFKKYLYLIIIEKLKVINESKNYSKDIKIQYNSRHIFLDEHY